MGMGIELYTVVGGFWNKMSALKFVRSVRSMLRSKAHNGLTRSDRSGNLSAQTQA